MLKAPYPWTGGKSKVAPIVWRAFGDVPNYIEPFFGSGAVLLGRPTEAKIETINDIDGAVVNFWRAIHADPIAVAEWCNWPVSELDLHARHSWLIERLATMSEELRADPDLFDAKVAGWWVWGICQWIGTGWCGGIKRGHPRPNLNDGQGIHAKGVWEQRPHASGSHPGMGVHRQLPKISVSDGASGTGGVHSSVPAGASAGKRPNLINSGIGVHRKRPICAGDNPGHGVHRKRPTCGNTGHGVHRIEGEGHHLPAIGNDRGINGLSAPPCLEWFEALAARLRKTRIICGDFRRVLGPSVLGKGKNVGGRKPTAVYLDPPYDVNLRTKRLYTEDEPGIAVAARNWALENGDDPDLRIALSGYFEEHDEHMPASWTRHRWTAARGYAGADNDNREQETIWFSPHCLPIADVQRSLFEGAS